LSEGLGTFTPPSAGGFVKPTPFSIADRLNRPLIVVVRDVKEGFTSVKAPNPHTVIFGMIADLKENKVYVNTLIGPVGIVDKLKGYVGTKLPVKFVQKASQKVGGNPYFSVEPLTGDELKFAELWDQKYPTRIADERAAAEAAAKAEAAAAEAAQEAGFSGLGSSAAPASQSVSDADLEAMMANL
jgi:hypothetical protein